MAGLVRFTLEGHRSTAPQEPKVFKGEGYAVSTTTTSEIVEARISNGTEFPICATRLTDDQEALSEPGITIMPCHM
jgi:hypothetical protein